MSTDIDIDDDLPVPHFEERLWHELAATHRAVRTQAFRPRQPRSLYGGGRRQLLMAAAAVGSAAAIVAAVAMVKIGDETGPAATQAGTPDEAGLAEQITAATDAALADSVVHVHQDNRGEGVSGTDDDSWSDETTGAVRYLQYGVDGEPTFDSGVVEAPSPDDTEPPPPETTVSSTPDGSVVMSQTGGGQQLYRDVDYCFSEYTETEQPVFPATNEAERIGERLAEGSLIEDGTEVVDGRELIRLIETNASIEAGQSGDTESTVTTEPAGTGSTITIPSSDGNTDPTITIPASESTDPTITIPASDDTTDPTITIPSSGGSSTTETTARSAAWAAGAAGPRQSDPNEVLGITFVDPETYRPVMRVGYPGTAADYSDAHYVQTYEYLPRTPENLANLVAPVPDGFTQVDQLRGDGERVDAGCG